MTEQAQPQFSIEKLYVKDASLEVPNAPEVFLERETPQIDVQLTIDNKNVSEDVYHVGLSVTVTAKKEDKTVFLVEVVQGGVFTIKNVPSEDLEPILSIACPNILFPYAREVVSDLVNRAGFPPVILAPINFEGLYAQRQQQEVGNA